MCRWKRILVSQGILVITSVAYLWFFGTQTFFVLEANNVARKFPFVKLTPVVLPDVAVSQKSGMNLSHFDYRPCLQHHVAAGYHQSLEAYSVHESIQKPAKYLTSFYQFLHRTNLPHPRRNR
jgi:hypothetical protein